MKTICALLVFCLSADISWAQEKAAPPSLASLKEQWHAGKLDTWLKRKRVLDAIADHAHRDSRAFLDDILAHCDEHRFRIQILQAIVRDKQHPRKSEIVRQIARQGKTPDERLKAVDLVGTHVGNWRSCLGNVSRRDESARVRHHSINLLAKKVHPESLRQLRATFRESIPATQAAVINAVGKAWKLGKIYNTFLLPVLSRQADPAPRQAALKILANLRDQRFFRYCTEIAAKELNESRIQQWISWASRFDSVQAVEFMMSQLGDGAVGRAQAFVRGAQIMKSEGVKRWFRGRAIMSGHPTLQLAAVKHILAQPGVEDAKALLSLARRRNREVSVDALAGLAGVKGAQVTRFLAKTVSHKDPERASEALRSWWRQTAGGLEAVKAALALAAQARDWQVRATALDLLGPEHLKGHRQTLLENFSHERNAVRSAAFAASTYLRTKQTVDALLTRMPKEDGRTLHDLVAALANLTGFDWGPKYPKWAAWWKKMRAEFVLPPWRAKTVSKHDAAYGRFYDIEVRTNRVVFVVDISGSMAWRNKKGVTKIDEAKTNLRKILKAFNSDVKFNLIAFNGGFRPWKKKLTAATPSRLKRAHTWVENLRAGGSTNIHDSLDFALDLKDVDTIFLLSDGAPSSGRTTDMGEIRRLIERKNRFRRIRINNIGIGVGRATRRFLEKLSKENFGEARFF